MQTSGGRLWKQINSQPNKSTPERSKNTQKVKDPAEDEKIKVQ